MLVLALNPSIDCEWQVDKVRWEEKNTVASERRWAGGKGVNVARWLKHLGENPQLLLPLGGATGKELALCLRQEELAAKIVPLREPTRVNIIVTTSARRQMRFNPKGPELSAREWQAILDTVKRQLSWSTFGLLALSGGLPRGLASDAYAEMLAIAHRQGTRCFLDCDGAPLASAVKARPFLVKPNVHELAEWSGQSLMSLSKIVAAAQTLSKITRGWVLVSRGQHGALLINARAQFQLACSATKVNPLNTVGAGDAMLAAIIHQVQRGSPPEEWLRWGIAVGTAATQTAAGKLPPQTAIQKLVTLPRLQRL